MTEALAEYKNIFLFFVHSAIFQSIIIAEFLQREQAIIKEYFCLLRNRKKNGKVKIIVGNEIYRPDKNRNFTD